MTSKHPKKGENGMTIYGYVRVSSTDQNEERQIIGLYSKVSGNPIIMV